MRIGIFTEVYHPTTNGVVFSIDAFKQQLEKKGHQYLVVTTNNHLARSEPNVYRFPAINFPLNTIYPLAYPMPFSLAKRWLPMEQIKRLDLIHVQHFSAMGQYGLSCAELFGIPVVYTFHTMAELYTNYIPLANASFVPIVRYWIRHTATRSQHVVVPTSSVKKYLQEIGVTKPVSVIPTGIDTKAYKRTPKAYLEHQYHIPTQRTILLYVGRLAKEKNLDFLIEAFDEVQKVAPETHLFLVGDGPDRRRYEDSVIRKGLSQNVTFTGFLNHLETIKIFGASDLFVFPSVTDTQGIVIIEAMASGTVPVAIDVLGPHDIIKDKVTGRLTPLNLNVFTGTIIDLLRHPDQVERMAAAGQQQAKLLDSAVTAASMEQLYERLTTHPRPQTNP